MSLFFYMKFNFLTFT